jgi:hypothetical protein
MHDASWSGVELNLFRTLTPAPPSTKSLTRAALWNRNALCSGVSSQRSETFTFVPCLSSNRMASRFPIPEASWSGVELDLFRILTSAPPLIRSSKTSWCRNALCNGESPQQSTAFTPAPWLSSNCMTPRFPIPEVSWSNVELDLFRTLTSAPLSMRSFTASWYRNTLCNGESPHHDGIYICTTAEQQLHDIYFSNS